MLECALVVLLPINLP